MTSVSKGYEFFDHTADIGICAKGTTLEELFIRMAQGLVELIAEESRLKPTERRPIQLTAAGADALLLKWLQEILFWFSTDRFLPVEYVLAEVTPTVLRGELRGGLFDPAHHIQGREVKAITRHRLDVKQERGCWIGQVIVDI